MKILSILLLLSSFNAFSDEIGDDYCKKWIQDKSGTPLVRLSELTAPKAKKAMKYMQELLEASHRIDDSPFLFEVLQYREAEIQIRGWMIKKEILDGYRLNQPDPEMKTVLCDYWSSAAF